MAGVLTLLFVVSAYLALTECRLQRVVVRGQLLCGDLPVNNILVKLFDKDIGFDDLLDHRMTNITGHFQVDGATREYTDIDPVVKIYHDCEDTWVCQRRLRLYVPKKYINEMERIDLDNPTRPAKILDIGVINLETYISGEDRDCFHKK